MAPCLVRIIGYDSKPATFGSDWDHDQPTWSFSKKGSYNCSETWEYIRDKKLPIVWWRLIWFPLAIPRQAFILWLAVLFEIDLQQGEAA
jgi:hypothetical protein